MIEETLEIWANPFTELRVPLIFNLRRDPYERAQKTRNTLGFLLEHHIDKLLLETDAPDMPMCGRQGEANEPRYLSDVVDVISDRYGMSHKEIVSTTTANYTRLFNIDAGSEA